MITLELTREQAREIADTLGWNVDLDTVRDDVDGGEHRAETIQWFRSTVYAALDAA